MLTEVTAKYDFSRDISATQTELLTIEQQVPSKGIMKLNEMARFIEMINKSSMIKFNTFK